MARSFAIFPASNIENMKVDLFVFAVRFFAVVSICILATAPLAAQSPRVFEVKSPNGRITVKVEAGAVLQWSVTHDGQAILAPSVMALHLGDGSLPGTGTKVASSATRAVNTSFNAFNYKKAAVKDHFNELTINFRGDYAVQYRAYDDGVAYRFVLKKKGDAIVKHEVSNFNFTANHKAFIPIQWDYRGGENFNSSFEALYREINLSQFPKDSLAFLPLLVDVGQNKKAVILEADLEDYPGMYLDLNETRQGLKGVFAKYPLETKQGGYNRMNLIPTKRAEHIARINGTRTLPWRAMVISTDDKELLDNDIVQRLASPNRVADVSWVKPGLVAWDWWNNWNVSNVDFKAGINTATYKHYIDFAASHKIPYIIMDAGWSPELDMMRINPDINLEEIVSYGKGKRVDVILWASWFAVLNQMEEAFPRYAAMGIKGFKIDFIDRDDQVAVASLYTIAKKAADHKLLVDYHGVFKPTGLHRTYPNVIGYEGVKGLENYKWADEDQPRYAVTIPFIRMMAGPMDYTPGAMRNSNQANFRAINDNPMSKGTRCNQMAMYVMYEAPLQMLSDNPTVYTKEKECTDFIVNVPVTYDETVALDGKLAEFAVIARRKGEAWYGAAMTNWTSRDVTIDFSFLPQGVYTAEIFRDGVNAERDGTDYKKEIAEVRSGEKLQVHLASGGGWVARIRRKN
jgi:alpha-glucosidase